MVQEELDKILLQEIVSALQAKRGHEIVELDMRPVHSPMQLHGDMSCGQFAAYCRIGRRGGRARRSCYGRISVPNL